MTLAQLIIALTQVAHENDCGHAEVNLLAVDRYESASGPLWKVEFKNGAVWLQTMED